MPPPSIDVRTARFPVALLALIGKNHPDGVCWGHTTSRRRDERTTTFRFSHSDAFRAFLTSHGRSPQISSFIRQLNIYGFRVVETHMVNRIVMWVCVPINALD
jgi:hypothetical protein